MLCMSFVWLGFSAKLWYFTPSYLLLPKDFCKELVCTGRATNKIPPSSPLTSLYQKMRLPHQMYFNDVYRRVCIILQQNICGKTHLSRIDTYYKKHDLRKFTQVLTITTFHVFQTVLIDIEEFFAREKHYIFNCNIKSEFHFSFTFCYRKKNFVR